MAFRMSSQEDFETKIVRFQNTHTEGGRKWFIERQKYPESYVDRRDM
jgi:hypothetical protein